MAKKRPSIDLGTLAGETKIKRNAITKKPKNDAKPKNEPIIEPIEPTIEVEPSKEKEQEYKTLRWYSETHKKAKIKASQRGMTIIKYLNWLIDKDKL